MSARPKRDRVSVGGIEARVLGAGPGTAEEAVVFVHGNPGSANDWEALALAVEASGLRAVAPDLPDFGETAAPARFEHSVGAYAGFLAELLDAVGVRRAHLVLHDFGGPIGLQWAAANPAALASVTLIDTGLLPGYRWHRLARIWRTPLLGELVQAGATRAGFHWLVNRGEPRRLSRPFIETMYDHYDRRTRRAVLRLYRATDRPGDAGAELAASGLARDVPALVIWGAHDVYLPSEYAFAQRAAFPAAEVHVLADSGHWPFIDAPEAVEGLLVEFLGRARSPG